MMNRMIAVILLTLFSCLASLLNSAHVFAQPFSISWYTIDSGGGFAAGGNLELHGTIGQHDAGPTMTGGDFSLSGGFWAAAATVTIVPDSYTLFRGILVNGALADVFESDDNRMRFNPGFVLNSGEAPVWLIFDGTLPSDSPASLEIVVESQVGTPGLTGTLEAWNWTNAGYVVVDVFESGFNNDLVLAVDLGPGITDYVQAGTGAVRSRIGWRKTGFTINYPWEVRIDQMVWTER